MPHVITYVLTSVGAFGMILLLARAGFESDEIKGFCWFEQAQSLVCCGDDDDDVLDGRHPVFRRIFCQILRAGFVVAAGHLRLAIAAVLFACWRFLLSAWSRCILTPGKHNADSRADERSRR